MNKLVYTKPPLSVQEQIELLKTRGMQIPDEDRASRYLQNISYFHLSGYMYPFLADKKQHQYKPNSSFDDIINLYRFDRELRILIFSTIEKIEVAIRAQVANHFAVNAKDAFWYTDAKYFSSPLDHQTFLNNTLSYIKRSTDVFIIHFFDTYSNIFPPIWVVLEVLSMGQLSILYNITKRSPSRKAIANYFCIKEPVLANWLHTLVYVRNICAHHARLWNKDLRIQIKNPKTINRSWLSSGDITKRKIYEVLAIIACFLDTITPANTFRMKLNDLLVKYPNIDVTAMGFPKDWKNDPFWSGIPKPLITQP
jgi:abortive infection bacteriophage resistance protein